jgi:chromate reductase
MGINIVTVGGAVRAGNYTAKALGLVHDELRKFAEVELHAIDLTAYRLPLPGQPDPDDSADEFRQVVRAATGLVLATPEYHGSFSSVLKLAIESLGFPSALAGKPISLLGVAAGEIGAIKSLEHLRSVCAHVGAIVLPALVSVPRVQTVFDEQGRCLDPRMEKRIRSLASTLLDYIRGAVCPRIALEAIIREKAETVGQKE